MKELTYHWRENPLDIEYLEESELESFLEIMSPHIGRIIIEFNSLEESVEFCAKEIISSTEAQDGLVYVFLAELGFTSKSKALLNLYGQIINNLEFDNLEQPLKELDTRLAESAKRRNQYAHGSWTGAIQKNYVCVKTKIKREGVFQVYRKFGESTMADDLNYIHETINYLIKFDDKFNEARI